LLREYVFQSGHDYFFQLIVNNDRAAIVILSY